MTQTNPYTGTDFEAAWAAGYTLGSTEPLTEHASPGDYDADHVTVFGEGELAGQEDAATRGGVDAPVPVDPRPPAEHHDSIVTEGGHLVEISMMIWGSLWHAGEIALHLSPSLPIELLILLITATEPPPGDEPTLRSYLAEQCASAACQELYLPISTAASDAVAASGTDAYTRAGYWHGSLFRDDPTGATQQAATYAADHLEHAGSIGVLRFQAATPDDLEFAPVQVRVDQGDWHPPLVSP